MDQAIISQFSLLFSMILGSWIASLSLLGALFGGLCSGLIIKHGRRKTLIYVSIPFSISWAFTLFAYCVEMIYATAFIAGFCSAIIQVSILKVHIFWEGHKILWNLHRRFVLCSASQIYGGDFTKFCGLLRIYELYLTIFKRLGQKLWNYYWFLEYIVKGKTKFFWNFLTFMYVP